MTLQESIVGVFKRNKVSAKEAYRRAMSEGKTPETLVRLAAAAGIGEEEIARDAAVIDQAAALVEEANAAPGLSKQLADARARHAAAVDEYNATVVKQAEKLGVAESEVAAIESKEQPARKALQALAALYREHPDLLPIANAPAAVRELQAAQDSESAISASRETVRRARAVVGVKERAIMEWKIEQRKPSRVPQPVIAGFDDAGAADARATIAKLESELGEAQKAADAAAAQHRKRFSEEI